MHVLKREREIPVKEGVSIVCSHQVMTQESDTKEHSPGAVLGYLEVYEAVFDVDHETIKYELNMLGLESQELTKIVLLRKVMKR